MVQLDDDGGYVAVCCRFRQLDAARGAAAKSLNVNTVQGKVTHGKPHEDHGTRKAQAASYDFEFAAAFEKEDNAKIYEVVGSPLVHSALMGYNGTLLAYGQTGSGKTFTIGEMGRLGSAQEGVAHRMVRALYEEIALDAQFSYSVEMQFVQVHIERIYDLLAERVSEHGHEVITPLSLREDRDGVFIQGAASLEAASADDALSLLKAASKRLAFAATKMNATSSRSHAVCSLTVTKHRMATPSPATIVQSARRWSTKPTQRRRLDGTRRAILRRNSPAHRPPHHLSLPQTVPTAAHSWTSHASQARRWSTPRQSAARPPPSTRTASSTAAPRSTRCSAPTAAAAPRATTSTPPTAAPTTSKRGVATR